MVAVLIGFAGIATGCSGDSTSEAPSSDGPTSSGTTAGTGTATGTGTAPASAAVGTARAGLADLVIKGRAPKTGYSRAAYGVAWTDTDHNGCDTRNDMLRRDLAPVTVQAGTHGCVVLSGTLADPYTATSIAFVRGATTSSRVQIDHVVALSDSWQKGAQQWNAAQRTAFANDPLELLAVDGPTNESKGDGDAATWLPPDTAYRCTYVARQISVKQKYRLSVTAAENRAMQQVLARCPTQPMVTDAEADMPKAATATTASPLAPGRTPPSSAAATPTGVYYPNCAAARAAGKAPLLRGQPGYSTRLDGDGDGIACE